jgi:hypothetical protein
VAEKSLQSLGPQQRPCESGGLVGQARQAQAGGLQRRKPFGHPGIDHAVSAVDRQVVLLVGAPGALEQRVRRHEIVDTALPFDVRQHRADQVLGALAHQLPDQLAIDRRPVQRRQHVVQRHFKVAQGVHQGAVEVDDAGVQFSEVR